MSDKLREAAQAALAEERKAGVPNDGKPWTSDDTAYRPGGLAQDDALAEQDAEPVAWAHNLIPNNIIRHRPADIDRHPDRWSPLYTHPPRREWRGLTDEERLDTFHSYLEQTADERVQFRDHLSYAEEELEAFNAGWAAAEAALREKSGGSP